MSLVKVGAVNYIISVVNNLTQTFNLLKKQNLAK